MPNDLNDIYRLVKIAERNGFDVRDEASAETAIQKLLGELQFEVNHIEHEINVVTKYLLKTYGRTTSCVDDYYDDEDGVDIMMSDDDTLVPFTTSPSNTT